MLLFSTNIALQNGVNKVARVEILSETQAVAEINLVAKYHEFTNAHCAAHIWSVPTNAMANLCPKCCMFSYKTDKYKHE